MVRFADRSCGPAPICVAASASIKPLHRVLEDASQHVRVCALELLEQCRGHHPVLGHRGSPGLGKSFQENSAVAFFVYLVGSAEVTPDLHHTTGHHSFRTSVHSSRVPRLRTVSMTPTFFLSGQPYT